MLPQCKLPFARQGGAAKGQGDLCSVSESPTRSRGKNGCRCLVAGQECLQSQFADGDVLSRSEARQRCQQLKLALRRTEAKRNRETQVLGRRRWWPFGNHTFELGDQRLASLAGMA